MSLRENREIGGLILLFDTAQPTEVIGQRVLRTKVVKNITGQVSRRS